MSHKTTVMNVEHPSHELAEVFEPQQDKTRRLWAEHSGDYAFGVLRWLQGPRAMEVSLAEILTTKVYARSNQRERDALRFVSEQTIQASPLTPADARVLVDRDTFLMEYADNRQVGHADWILELEIVRIGIADAQKFDAAMFPKTFSQPKLFGWVFGRRIAA